MISTLPRPQHNEKDSAVNKTLGGTIYTGQKLACSSIGEEMTYVNKRSSLFLVLVPPSNWRRSLIIE